MISSTPPVRRRETAMAIACPTIRRSAAFDRTAHEAVRGRNADCGFAGH